MKSVKGPNARPGKLHCRRTAVKETEASAESDEGAGVAREELPEKGRLGKRP
jgi:hypothetical protein